MAGLATDPKMIMIGTTYLGAPYTAYSLRAQKGGRSCQIGRTKGGMNTKLHAVTDATGRPISFYMSTGQASDDTGAAALLGDLPKAEWLLADCGYAAY